MSKIRTFEVPALARVEGEGGLFVRTEGDQVREVRLNIYEPPRFFEAFLRGRPLEEVPDITARICGICPVAYQMSAAHALEAALGITISPQVRRLRRLLYCGEWIESHALHVHLLHAPDFLGYDSGVAMAERFPDEVKRGLRLKKHGNELLEALGGRAIHPINTAIGGFYRAPRREELAKLIPDFEWGLAAAIDTTRWVATLAMPDFQQDYDLVALSHPSEYAMNEGAVVSTRYGAVPVVEYEQHYEERHVAHSTALHSVRIPQETSYLVGPLARVVINFDRLSPTALQVAKEVGLSPSCRNPYQSIVARCVELVHAYEEALDILKSYDPPRPPRAEYRYGVGEGCAATEAPRGLIYHRYQVDENGLITFAKITPPTSQNQAQIEADLRDFLGTRLHLEDPAAAHECEKLVRNYDPCISCSTHFLRVTFQRDAWNQP